MSQSPPYTSSPLFFSSSAQYHLNFCWSNSLRLSFTALCSVVASMFMDGQETRQFLKRFYTFKQDNPLKYTKENPNQKRKNRRAFAFTKATFTERNTNSKVSCIEKSMMNCETHKADMWVPLSTITTLLLPLHPHCLLLYHQTHLPSF
ncbi:hypothetical protein L1887_21494 [Cichorium endivia]|nr:hypothetical protein L1887_21494 [Cichorium endivia]